MIEMHDPFRVLRCCMTENMSHFRCSWSLVCCLLMGGLLVVSVGAASVEMTEGLNVTFQKGAYTDLFAVGEAADGGYLTGGFGYGSGNDSALLMKLNTEGAEQWSASLEADCVAALVPMDDGGAVAGTYTVDGGFLTFSDWDNATGSSSLVRFDADGNQVWSVTLAGLRLTDLAALPDGGIAVTGWLWKPEGKADAFLGVYDASGSERWTKTYAGGAARTLSTASDGSFVIGGTASPVIDVFNDGWVMKTDASGTEIWTKEIANRSILTSLPTSGDGYLLGGSMTGPYGDNGTMVAAYAWAAQVDGNGDIEWEQQVPGVEIDAVAKLPDTGYVFAGRWGSFPQLQIADYEGNVLNEQVWKDWKGRISSVAVTEAGEIVASGWSGMNSDAEGWLVSFTTGSGAATTEPTTASTEVPGFAAAGAGAALMLAGILRKIQK